MRLIAILTLVIEKDKKKLKPLLLNSKNNSPNKIILLSQWMIIMMNIDSLKDKGKFLDENNECIWWKKKSKK
jgi:hypothetical protein